MFVNFFVLSMLFSCWVTVHLSEVLSWWQLVGRARLWQDLKW